jgi:hypothetical protein
MRKRSAPILVGAVALAGALSGCGVSHDAADPGRGLVEPAVGNVTGSPAHFA